MPWLRKLLADPPSRRRGFSSRPISVGFEVDKVVLEKVFARIVRFSPIFIISPVLPTHSLTYHLRYINSAIDSVVKHTLVCLTTL